MAEKETRSEALRLMRSLGLGVGIMGRSKDDIVAGNLEAASRMISEDWGYSPDEARTIVSYFSVSLRARAVDLVEIEASRIPLEIPIPDRNAPWYDPLAPGLRFVARLGPVIGALDVEYVGHTRRVTFEGKTIDPAVLDQVWEVFERERRQL